MSGFMRMTLKQAIPEAEKLFESFGVKSVIIHKGNDWINSVTVIQLTRRKVDDLSNEFRFLEEKLGKIDEDNFKITLQAKPIQEFGKTVKELENGYLKIGDIQTKFLVRNVQAIANQPIGFMSGSVARVGEYAEYNFYSVTMGMDTEPFNFLLSDLQAFASSMGFRDQNELLHSWLGLESFYQANALFVLIPIYATVGEIQYHGGAEIKVTLKIDQRLYDNSYVWVTRSPQGDRAPIVERKKYELASCEKVLQDGFIYITIRHKFLAINVDDRISVSLSNSKFNLLARKEYNANQFPSEASDPFLKVFALFDAGKKMDEHLLNPNKSGDLVAAFSWLLEMIGFSAFRMGLEECVREEKAEKGSADVVGRYHEGNSTTIIVVDCTMGVPDGNKIDKIRNTAEYISRKIGFPVKPVIVTSEKSSITKEQGEKHGVKIIDQTDLEKILGFYKKGWDFPARKVILGRT